MYLHWCTGYLDNVREQAATEFRRKQKSLEFLCTIVQNTFKYHIISGNGYARVWSKPHLDRPSDRGQMVRNKCKGQTCRTGFDKHGNPQGKGERKCWLSLERKWNNQSRVSGSQFSRLDYCLDTVSPRKPGHQTREMPFLIWGTGEQSVASAGEIREVSMQAWSTMVGEVPSSVDFYEPSQSPVPNYIQIVTHTLQR